jgi:hypothetical protein
MNRGAYPLFDKAKRHAVLFKLQGVNGRGEDKPSSSRSKPYFPQFPVN